jgi:hypothetical protein
MIFWLVLELEIRKMVMDSFKNKIFMPPMSLTNMHKGLGFLKNIYLFIIIIIILGVLCFEGGEWGCVDLFLFWLFLICSD